MNRQAPDFEAVWSGLPVPAFILDDMLKIAAVNPAAENLVALSAKQMIGKGFDTFLGAGSRVAEVVRHAAMDGVSVVQHDIEVAWLDRTLRLGTLQANPISRDASDIVVLMSPRGLAEKIDRSFGSRTAARSVTGMAAMLAHEIRNPLAGIKGAAQLLSMGQADEDRELTDLIEAEAVRIGDLVSRVEEFGDLSIMDREPVNIHDVLSRAVTAARAGFGRHARISEEYDPSLPPTSGDAGRLMQVFQNILKNAAEAIPPVGGAITVRTAFRPGIRLKMPGARAVGLPLEILITDNGGGIPQHLMADIFDPFVTTKVNGSGLGLSLVSKIIADHGGAIDCDSEPGATVFFLRLPVWDERSGTEGE